MPVPSGTYLRYSSVGEREDLSDLISNITPRATPFQSMIGRGPNATQSLTEWQIDTLETPDGANAQLEGDDATYVTPTPTVRVGNYTQISRKTVRVSGTIMATKKAGRRDEKAYQLALRAAALKRDVETIFLQNQGGDGGDPGNPRLLAALPAWVKTNVDFGAGGANPVYTSGVPGAPRTDGTQRAFSETIAKNVLQQAYTEGGEPKVLMVGPFNKTVVSSTFSGIAVRNYDLSNVDPRPTAVIASVDIYVSDFGTLRVLINRFQRERDAWFLDPEFMDMSFLRPFGEENLAKTGDSMPSMILGEYTLRVKNEAAIGLAADLLTS